MSVYMPDTRKLLEEAKRLGKHKTKKDALVAALSEYVQHQKRLGIVEYFGKVEYYDDYDYKAARNRKRAKVLSS
ncbi:MAG: type II toxin-antitoxin system VapB family antitoxin [Candidatus Sumerlaeota bacterium]|nr:type II toxin-antitoxin system VapB family antitoxin [Candidatus Sumerlaeota bacterium]